MKKAAYILVWGLLFAPPVAHAASRPDVKHRQHDAQKLAKKQAKNARKQRDKQAKALQKWKRAHGVR